MRRVMTVVLGLATLVACGGWGRDGHAVIAEIAWREMTPEARARASEILGGEPLPSIASWADAVRGQGSYAWTGPLHYVNIPADATGYDHARDCPDAGCAVSGIRDFAALLADPASDEKTRREALMFVVHFVGDLHQPLHAGRAEDRGGNDVKIRFFGAERNLHSVWDSGILDRARPAEQRPEPWPLVADRLFAAIDPQDRLAWSADAAPQDLIATAGRWAFESHRLAERYCYPVGAGSELGEAYVLETIPVVETRLSQAGVRLGALLNGLLDPWSPGLCPTVRESRGQDDAPAE